MSFKSDRLELGLSLIADESWAIQNKNKFQNLSVIVINT